MSKTVSAQKTALPKDDRPDTGILTSGRHRCVLDSNMRALGCPQVLESFETLGLLTGLFKSLEMCGTSREDNRSRDPDRESIERSRLEAGKISNR